VDLCNALMLQRLGRAVMTTAVRCVCMLFTEDTVNLFLA
jgi:hypothetical protein